MGGCECSLDSARVKMRWKGEVECTDVWSMAMLRILDYMTCIVVSALGFGRGSPSAAPAKGAARPEVRSARFEGFCDFLCLLLSGFAFFTQKPPLRVYSLFLLVADHFFCYRAQFHLSYAAFTKICSILFFIHFIF